MFVSATAMKQAFEANDTEKVNALWDGANRQLLDAIGIVLQVGGDEWVDTDEAADLLLCAVNTFQQVEKWRRGEMTADDVKHLRVWCPTIADTQE